jgi:hypothetical protein
LVVCMYHFSSYILINYRRKGSVRKTHFPSFSFDFTFLFSLFSSLHFSHSLPLPLARVNYGFDSSHHGYTLVTNHQTTLFWLIGRMASDLPQNTVEAFLSLVHHITHPILDLISDITQVSPTHLAYISQVLLDQVQIDSSALKFRTYYMISHLSKTIIQYGENLQNGWNVSRMMRENWEGMGELGKAIMVGWGVLGIIIIITVVIAFRSGAAVDKVLPYVPEKGDVTAADRFLGIQLLSEPSLSKPDFKSNSSPEFSSVSTSRTISTSTTNTTDSTSATTSSDTQTELQNHHLKPNKNQPPHLILIQYIHPKTSFWPPYYLQAFHKAQQSATEHEMILGGHVDAPPSSGTRGNKDGCRGKIVLDKKVVNKDIKSGVVRYREGVTGLVSSLTILHVD